LAPGSLLRTQLTVEPVAVKEVARELVLPGVVEADPARTVNVMPPVTGRVIDLMAQLGGRVTKSQGLAIIDSGDLAQAISDEEKARSALKLAKQTLDRLMVLERTSAIAVRDREQAQSDFAQAQTRTLGCAPSCDRRPDGSTGKYPTAEGECTDLRQRDLAFGSSRCVRQRSDLRDDDDREPRYGVGHCQCA
jgi:hypothetical protein